ncbi:MAG TPA: type IV pilus secretin family protein [Nitrospinaceae bacterium]|nr:type IV pilus secretin family protein [Nitrospinaceae bacterium]
MKPYNLFIFLFFFLTVYVGACAPSLAPFLEKTHPKDLLETPSENTPSFSLSTGNEKNGEIILSIHSYSLIRYTVSSLLDPLRLVLDFTEMKKGGLPDLFPVNRGVVDKVRTFYFRNGNVLRMEIFLNQDANYHIKAGSENKLSIHLDYAPAQQSKAEESSVPEKPIQTESIPSSEKALLGRSSVTATDTDSCKVLLDEADEKIDLDFQGASLTNILRIFSEISGFNIIIADQVKGNVNIKLHSVPWNQAFKIILDNHQLAIRCIGDNIINVVPLADIEKEIAAQAAIRTAAEKEEALKKAAAINSEAMITEVKRINYGLISDISKSLDPFKSEGGHIIVDKRTNTFILTDLRANIEKMLWSIEIMDKKTPQILIESRIVEVSKDYSKELGIQWGLTGSFVPKDAITDFNTQRAKRVVITDASGQQGVGNTLVNLGTASTATSGVGIIIGNILSGLDLDIKLSALESEGRGRILSAPKIMTTDNHTAKISSGRQIPFQTTSQEGTQTDFVDAALSLEVTPHVTSDGNVLLDITATKNAADFANVASTDNLPTITTNEAISQVIVQNGGTTVLGGIFERTITGVEQKVPFFSEIPFLGWLFKNADDADTVSELLIFITPTIVMDNKGTIRGEYPTILHGAIKH